MLGTHVGRGAACTVVAAGELALGLAQAAREAEVADLQLALAVEHEVQRLQIMMDERLRRAVRIIKRGTEGGQQCVQVGHLKDLVRQLTPVGIQRGAVDVFHADGGGAVLLMEVVDADDVVMAQVTGFEHFITQVINGGRIMADFLGQEFQGDELVLERGVLRQPNHAHAAAAESPDEPEGAEPEAFLQRGGDGEAVPGELHHFLRHLQRRAEEVVQGGNLAEVQALHDGPEEGLLPDLHFEALQVRRSLQDSEARLLQRSHIAPPRAATARGAGMDMHSHGHDPGALQLDADDDGIRPFIRRKRPAEAMLHKPALEPLAAKLEDHLGDRLSKNGGDADLKQAAIPRHQQAGEAAV